MCACLRGLVFVPVCVCVSICETRGGASSDSMVLVSLFCVAQIVRIDRGLVRSVVVIHRCALINVCEVL